MIDITPKQIKILSAEEEIIVPELFQDVPSQIVGGWNAGSGQLSQGKVSIQANKERILLGDATDNNVFKADSNGIYLGNAVFADAPFKVDMNGIIEAKRLTLKNFVNDNNPSIVYTGTWTQQTVGTLYGGTRTLSNTVGDYFTISFFGISIGLIFERASNLGKVTIYIDDVEIETIDLYSTTLWSRSVAWKKIDLSNTNHILKAVVATKNLDASDNRVGFQGYTLFPHEGIKLEQLSCDLYVYGVDLLTDANGYVKTTISVPIGYSVYCIVGMRLLEGVMSDATTTDPKFAWRGTELYLYNGAANTTYSVGITLLLSKI